jgi:hypothetical protein
MSKIKQTMKVTNEPLDIKYDEDYLYEQYLTQEKLNEEYWEMKAKETIDIINATYDNRFCYADVVAAICEITNDEILANEIGKKLNELYVRRMTFDAQINQ